MDLTSAMLRYRECARHVWNVYFQPMPEGWHEFINVNHELVKEGWCWWDRPHAPESAILEALEAEARDASRGLWIDPSPVSPWAWRKLAK